MHVYFTRCGYEHARRVSSWKRGKILANRLAKAGGNSDIQLIRELPERLGRPETTVLLTLPNGWALVKWEWKNKRSTNSDYRWCLHQYTP
jgi:hypothetical protein